MGSGLILLLIVGAWLAVLVPMALRSHDAASALATVDRFHDAMRVLSRRDGRSRAGEPASSPGGSPEASPATVPPQSRAGSPSGPPVPAPAAAASLDADPGLRPDRPSRSGPTPAARRRRALLVLVLVAVLTLVGGLLGPVWVLVPHVVADLLLVAFLGWSRNQAVARAEREWRAAMGDRRSSGRDDQAWSPLQEWSDDWVRAADGGRGQVQVPEQPGPAAAADVPDVPHVPEVFDQEALEALPDAGAAVPAPRLTAVPVPPQAPARGAQGEPWSPVPVPVPTYVTAPRAPRRVVDLTAPRPAAQALAAAERSLGIDDRGPELEHILGRRAVGD